MVTNNYISIASCSGSAHAWKACIGKPIEGSNPSSSARCTEVKSGYEAIFVIVGSVRCLLDIKLAYPHSSQRTIGPFSAFITSSRSCERHKKHSGRLFICDMATPFLASNWLGKQFNFPPALCATR